jgi:hypothetical protein
MSESSPMVAGRLCLAALLNAVLLFYGFAQFAMFSTHTRQVWAHFWIAVTAALSMAVVGPLLVRKSLLVRVLSSLLLVIPVAIFIAVLVDHFYS